MTFMRHIKTLQACYDGHHQITRCKNAEIVILGDTLYILGTNDPEDVMQDLDAVPVKWRDGKVHAGFLKHAEAIASDPAAHVYTCRTIVGHSLGGAAAQILGATYGKEVITFGSPRVWWTYPEAWAEGYHHTRICHRSDPIVSLPPWWLGWHHRQDVGIALGKPWWKTIWSTLFNRKKRIISYHLPPAYLAGLEGIDDAKAAYGP